MNKAKILIVIGFAFLLAIGVKAITISPEEIKELQSLYSGQEQMLGGSGRLSTETLRMYTATTTGVSSAIRVGQYRNIVFAVTASSTPAMTIKFQGSTSNESPDFSIAANEDNHWDYIQVTDLQNGVPVFGDTGLVISAADLRIFEANTNGLKWVSVNTTAFTSGTTTVDVTLFNNN
jgi:hypothetical protein